MKLTTKLWIFMTILAVLTPIGLKLPEIAKSGPAWGEWDAEKVKELAGYIPRGLAKYSSVWRSPMPGYAFEGQVGKILRDPSFAYIISAVVGILVATILMMLVVKSLNRRE